MRSFWGRVFNAVLSIGGYPGESSDRKGGRRLWIAAVVIATFLTIPNAIGLTNTKPRVAFAVWVVVAAGFLALGLLRLRPKWFPWIVNGMSAVVVAETFYTTPLIGGIVAGEFGAVFLLIIPLGMLMVLGRRAAIVWFVVYVVTIVASAVIPNFVDPIYDTTPTDAGAAESLILVGIVVMAITLYFVRQRDRFQRQSDDLLHNILPAEIAARLKNQETMIADDFPEASVLFADVVGFTPMSATMSPTELVGLLNQLFSDFDGFVADLGLEKIKTVGDEYMVASGVPLPRSDHAEAIAELALRIRDHVASEDFNGHQIRLRIGINSGPVVAGIVGINKFAYDLWGDVVNTASRMESEGIPGSIQVTPATYELIRDGFVCEPRGVVSVKGKGDMNTYILISKRDKADLTHEARNP
jgi:adenylate cyclase